MGARLIVVSNRVAVPGVPRAPSALVESHSGGGILDGIRWLFGALSEQRSFATQGSLATR
jgi:hypothetical protein